MDPEELLNIVFAGDIQMPDPGITPQRLAALDAVDRALEHRASGKTDQLYDPFSGEPVIEHITSDGATYTAFGESIFYATEQP